MTDYALHRMNTREFEHLAQALLLGKFGAAVEIFGDGSDNDREAFYTGTLKMALDDRDQDWTGDTPRGNSQNPIAYVDATAF